MIILNTNDIVLSFFSQNTLWYAAHRMADCIQFTISYTYILNTHAYCLHIKTMNHHQFDTKKKKCKDSLYFTRNP